MPILNYTTTVSADKTIAEITKKLVAAGASQIASEYHDGQAIAIAFMINTPEGPRKFVLPANVQGVMGALHDERVAKRWRSYEQATRVAWRIVKDWIEAQLAMVEARMVRLEQVMFPYMLVNAAQETAWDVYLSGQLEIGDGS